MTHEVLLHLKTNKKTRWSSRSFNLDHSNPELSAAQLELLNEILPRTLPGYVFLFLEIMLIVLPLLQIYSWGSLGNSNWKWIYCFYLWFPFITVTQAIDRYNQAKRLFASLMTTWNESDDILDGGQAVGWTFDLSYSFWRGVQAEIKKVKFANGQFKEADGINGIILISS